MSATITINPSEIRQIFQPRTSKSSQLWELTEKANSLAVMVEENWESISDEDKELLKDFAYDEIQSPTNLGIFRTFIKRFYSALMVGWIVFKGEEDAFVAYVSAYKSLINAILKMSERKNNKAMSAKEACEWIRELSDKAYREL